MTTSKFFELAKAAKAALESKASAKEALASSTEAGALKKASAKNESATRAFALAVIKEHKDCTSKAAFEEARREEVSRLASKPLAGLLSKALALANENGAQCALFLAEKQGITKAYKALLVSRNERQEALLKRHAGQERLMALGLAAWKSSGAMPQEATLDDLTLRESVQALEEGIKIEAEKEASQAESTRLTKLQEIWGHCSQETKDTFLKGI